MIKAIFKNKLIVIFAMAGLLGGFAYWYFIGCNTGTCPLTSTWHYSTLAGGLIGYLGGDMFNDIVKKRKSKEDSDLS